MRKFAREGKMETQINKTKTKAKAKASEPVAAIAIEASIEAPIEAPTPAPVDAKAKAMEAIAMRAAQAAIDWGRDGSGPAAESVREEVLAIIREETRRHGQIDGAKAVAKWLLRNSGGETAVARAAMASAIGSVFKGLVRQSRNTKAAVGLAAFIHSEDASLASTQAGLAAAAAAAAVERRALVAGHKAAAAAAAAATLRPLFRTLEGATNGALKVLDREDGAKLARDRSAAKGRLRYLIGAARGMENLTDAEAEVIVDAESVLGSMA